MTTLGPSSARAAATGSRRSSDGSNRAWPRVAPIALQLSLMEKNSFSSPCPRHGGVDIIPGGKCSKSGQPISRSDRPIFGLGPGSGGVAGRDSRARSRGDIVGANSHFEAPDRALSPAIDRPVLGFVTPWVRPTYVVQLVQLKASAVPERRSKPSAI